MMQNSTSSDIINSDDTNKPITFFVIKNEVLLLVKILFRNFIKFFIVGLIGCGLGYVYAYFDTPMYQANTRFMLKNEGVGSLFGGQMTGLTSLLGGGQMGTPLERTSEVIASDKILGKALLKPTQLGDKYDLIINHFINLSQLKKKWSKDTLLSKVIFNTSDTVLERLNLAQRKAYRVVRNFMTPEKGVGVIRKSFDKKSGVLTLSCVHHSEDFSILLSKVIYDQLSDFFIEQMTYTSSYNAGVMSNKLDSIKRELDYTRRSYARLSDQSLGLLLQQDKVELKSLTVKEQMLTVMYAEALKNFELYSFMNSAAIPSLTLIDYPYSPLKPSKKSTLLFTIVFGLLTMLLLLFYFRLIPNDKTK